MADECAEEDSQESRSRAQGLEPPGPARRRPEPAERALALIEVLVCSGYPTQIFVASTLLLFGYGPATVDDLTTTYVVTLSLIDTALLTTLIVFFLVMRGDDPRRVFLGGRPTLTEINIGLPLIFVALLVAAIVLIAIHNLAPWLRTVEQNPLQQLLDTPIDMAMFAIVVVIAGGVREELQRAFLLNRFERWLGGGTMGVFVTSVAFGAGHVLQGADAGVATGALGALWAVVYLRRRSVVAPMVSHAGFNLIQLVQFALVRG